jgi:hypothetical protein
MKYVLAIISDSGGTSAPEWAGEFDINITTLRELTCGL